MADLPQKKPVPPMKQNLYNSVSEDYVNRDKEKRSFVTQMNDRYNRKDPMEDRSDEEQNLSRRMKTMGFKKGGSVKGKSVPQSQKKNRKKI